jgi:hypothetical protein
MTSPGLFGGFSWVENKQQYAAVLFTFCLKNKGRNQRYGELKKSPIAKSYPAGIRLASQSFVFL